MTTSKSVIPEPPTPEKNLPAIASTIEFESPLENISYLSSTKILLPLTTSGIQPRKANTRLELGTCSHRYHKVAHTVNVRVKSSKKYQTGSLTRGKVTANPKLYTVTSHDPMEPLSKSDAIVP